MSIKGLRGIGKMLDKEIKSLNKKKGAMRGFKVVWEERRSVVVYARTAEDAEEIIQDGDYSAKDVDDELMTMPEAFEITERKDDEKKV